MSRVFGHGVWNWSPRWNGSNAVELDTKVEFRLAKWKLEEAVLSPVGSPRVSHNPVLLSRSSILSPSYNGDLVVDLNWKWELFMVDSTLVGVNQLVCGLDSTSDWPVLVNLSLHLISSSQAVVSVDVVSSVIGDGLAVIPTCLTSWTGWSMAVTANVNWLAFAGLLVVVKVMSNILKARGMWNSFNVSNIVDSTWLSTVATASIFTVNDSLGTQSNWSGLVCTKEDVESIG